MTDDATVFLQHLAAGCRAAADWWEHQARHLEGADQPPPGPGPIRHDLAAQLTAAFCRRAAAQERAHAARLNTAIADTQRKANHP